MTRRKFLIQGAVLTAVSLLLRVTNMGYRSFLSQDCLLYTSRCV